MASWPGLPGCGFPEAGRVLLGTCDTPLSRFLCADRVISSPSPGCVLPRTAVRRGQPSSAVGPVPPPTSVDPVPPPTSVEPVPPQTSEDSAPPPPSVDTESPRTFGDQVTLPLSVDPVPSRTSVEPLSRPTPVHTVGPLYKLEAIPALRPHLSNYALTHV